MAPEKERPRVEAQARIWSKITSNLLNLSSQVTLTTKASSKEKCKAAKA
jgi:hypothetical protein